MSTVAHDKALDILERRLATLENKIFEDESKKASGLGVTGSATPAVTKLTEMAKECGNALERRERIAPLLRKINDLETYLVSFQLV
jgi:hypothetical protein